MTSSLPAVPAGGRLTQYTSGDALSGTRTSRATHARAPRLETVACLDYHRGWLVAGGNRVCCVWDTRSMRLTRRIVVDEPIGAIFLVRDHSCVVIGTGCSVEVHDLAAGEVLRYAHEAPVTSVHVGDLTHLLASGDSAGGVTLCDRRTAQPLHRLRFEAGGTNVYAVGARYVLVETVRGSDIVDARTGEVVRRFPYDPLAGVATGGPNFPDLLVGYTGATMHWFRCSQVARPFCTHDLGSRIVSMDIANGLVLAPTTSGDIRIFELSTGGPYATWSSFTRPLRYAKFGEGISVYAAGGEALVMHLVDGKHVRSFYDETAPLVTMTMPPGEPRAVLLSNRDGGIARVDLASGRRTADFVGHSGSVSALACDAARVVSGAYDGSVRVWTGDGQQTALYPLEEGPVQALALAADGSRLWAGTWLGNVKSIDLRTGEAGQAFACGSSSVRSLVVTACGRRVYAGGDEGHIALHDTHSCAPPHVRKFQSGAAYRCLLPGDGCLWVSAQDGVRRHDEQTLELMDCFPGRDIRWFAVESGRLYSLSLGGELQVHDIRSGQLLRRTCLEPDYMHRAIVVLSRDRILTASSDGHARVFDEALRPVATLELLRTGILWSMPDDPQRPQWLFTDREDVILVGETQDGSHHPYKVDDPRRHRYLALRNSAHHIMAIVNGAAAPAGLPSRLSASPLAAATSLLGFQPVSPPSQGGRHLGGAAPVNSNPGLNLSDRFRR